MSRLGKGIGTPSKMDENAWKSFFDYLEKPPRADSSLNAAAESSTAVLTSAASPTLDVPLTAATKSSISSEASSAETPYLRENYELGGSQLQQQQNIVVLSDSDTDDEPISSKSDYKRLREKARCLVFHRFMKIFMHHSNGSNESSFDDISEDNLFSYEKLKELSKDLRKFQQEIAHNEKELAFLWNNVIQWLSAVKLSLDPMDLNNEQFNLILIDFMVQYLNYITSIFCNINDETKTEEKVSEVVQTLNVILNGNVSHILMVLLRIDLKSKYRSILVPIFRKYLTDRNLRQTSNDLVVYLRLIFCFKRWKMITPLKTDREAINEIAVGKSMQTLKREGNSEIVDLTNESILPKSVPRVNVQNECFISISDLIGFAIKHKTTGTRILLVYTSLDLENAISKYFQLYERYVSRNATSDVLTTLCMDTNRLHMGTTDTNLSQYRNSQRMNSNVSTCQLQRRRERNSNDAKASKHLLQRRSTLRQTHLYADCDSDKTKLDNSTISNVSNFRSKNTNTQSDITLSLKSNSAAKNLLNTSIDLTVNDDEPAKTMILSSSDEENNVRQVSNKSNTESENKQSSDSLEKSLPTNENILVLEQCMPRIAAIPPRCRPLRKEKNCIPGEVSSTTSPDFVMQNKNLQNQNEECSVNMTAASEQSSTSFGFNQPVLEVHSAGGTLQTGREVGVVKAIQHHVDPCPPANQRAILLGLYYDDVSSENDDEEESDEENETGAKLQNLSHKNWKVVKEATSSTSEFPKVLSNNVIFSTRLDRSQFQGQKSETSLQKRINKSISDSESESFQTVINQTNKSNLQDLSKTIFSNHDSPICSKYIQRNNSDQINGNENQTAIKKDFTITISKLVEDENSEILQTSHACITDISKNAEVDEIDDLHTESQINVTRENERLINFTPSEATDLLEAVAANEINQVDHLNDCGIVSKTSTETQIIKDIQHNENLPPTTDVRNKQVVNEIIEVGKVNKSGNNSESQSVMEKECLEGIQTDLKKMQTPAEALNSSLLSVKCGAKPTDMVDKENSINLNKVSTNLMVPEAKLISKQKSTKISTKVELRSTVELTPTQLEGTPQNDFSIIEPKEISKILQVSEKVSDVCENNQINKTSVRDSDTQLIENKSDFVQNNTETPVASFEIKEIDLTKKLSSCPAIFTDKSAKTNNAENNSSSQESMSTELLDTNNTNVQKDIKRKTLILKNTPLDLKHKKSAPEQIKQSFILDSDIKVCNAESKKIVSNHSSNPNTTDKESNSSANAKFVAINLEENQSCYKLISRKTTEKTRLSSKDSTQAQIAVPKTLSIIADQSVDTEAVRREKQDLKCNQTDSSIYKNKDSSTMENKMEVEIINEVVEISEVSPMVQHTIQKRPKEVASVAVNSFDDAVKLNQLNTIAINAVVLESSININKQHSNTVSSETTKGKVDTSKTTLFNESRFINKNVKQCVSSQVKCDSKVVPLENCNENFSNKNTLADENLVINLPTSVSVLDVTEKSVDDETEKSIDDKSELKNIEVVENIKHNQYRKDNGKVTQTPKISLDVKNSNCCPNVFETSTFPEKVPLNARVDEEKNFNVPKKIMQVDDTKEDTFQCLQDVDKIKIINCTKTEQVIIDRAEKHVVEKKMIGKDIKFNIQKYSTPSDQKENKFNSIENDKIIIESTKTSIGNNLKGQTNQTVSIVDMDINSCDNKNQTTEFPESLDEVCLEKQKINDENASESLTKLNENKSELLKVDKIVDMIETSSLKKAQSQIYLTASNSDLDINKCNKSEIIEFFKHTEEECVEQNKVNDGNELRDPVDLKENKSVILEVDKTTNTTEISVVNNVKNQLNQSVVSIDVDINKNATKNKTAKFSKFLELESVEKKKVNDQNVSRGPTDLKINKLEILEVDKIIEMTETSIVNNAKNQLNETVVNMDVDINKNANKNKPSEFSKPADVECVEEKTVTNLKINELELPEVNKIIVTSETSIVNNAKSCLHQTVVNIDMDINKNANKNKTAKFSKSADVESVEKKKINDKNVSRGPTDLKINKLEMPKVDKVIEATKTCVEKNKVIENELEGDAESKNFKEITEPNNDALTNASNKNEQKENLNEKFINKECIREKIINEESELELQQKLTSIPTEKSYKTKNNNAIVCSNTNVELDKNVATLDDNILKEGDNSHSQLSSAKKCFEEENLLIIQTSLTPSLTEVSSSRETDSNLNKNDKTEKLKEYSNLNKKSCEAYNKIAPSKSKSDEIEACNEENTAAIGVISTPVENSLSCSETTIDFIKPFSKLQLSIRDDIEQRTPWKMRIKRQLSRGFVEFNFDSDEDEHRSDTSSTSDILENFLQSSTVNFPNVLKDAEELALNISKLDLKKNRTESGSDSSNCEDNFIALEDEWFRNLGLLNNKRNNLADHETNELNIHKNEDNQDLGTVNKPNLDTSTKQSFDQMPTSYKEEEIVAVTALMNMQNKKYQNKADVNMLATTKEVSATDVGKVGRPKTRKLDKVSPEYVTTTNNDVVISAISDVPPVKILKSAFKSKINANVPKKKVTYDEQNLEDNKLLLKPTKNNHEEFKNKSEKYRNAEVKKKGSKKSVRERLAEINAQFKNEMSLMSDSTEDLGCQLINDDDNHIVEVADHCKEIDSETPITVKNIDEKQSMDTHVVKPGRGRKKKNFNKQAIQEDTLNNSILLTQVTKNKQDDVTAECIYPVRLTTRGSAKTVDTQIFLPDADLHQTDYCIKPNNNTKCKSIRKAETVVNELANENNLLIVPDIEENPNKKRKFETKKALVRIRRMDFNKKISASENKFKENMPILKECQIKQEPIEETEGIFFQPNNVEELTNFNKSANNTFKGKSGCKEIIVRPCDIILTEDIINAQAYELKKSSKIATRQLYKRNAIQNQAAANIKLETKERDHCNKTSKLLAEDVNAGTNLSADELTETSFCLKKKNVKIADISVDTDLVGDKRKSSLNDKQESNDSGITTIPEKKLSARRTKKITDYVENVETETSNDIRAIENISKLKIVICKTSKASNNKKSTKKVTDILDTVVAVEDTKTSDSTKNKSEIITEDKILSKTETNAIEITKLNQKVIADLIEEKRNEIKSLKDKAKFEETTTSSESNISAFGKKTKGDVTKTDNIEKVTAKNAEFKILENKATVVDITKTRTKDLNVGKTNKKRSIEPLNIKSNEITKDSDYIKKLFEVKTEVLTSKIRVDGVNVTTIANDTNKIAEKSADDKTLESSAEEDEITKTKTKDLNVGKTNKKRSIEPPNVKSTTVNDTYKIAEKNADDKTLESSAEDVEIPKTKVKDLNLGKTSKKRSTEPIIKSTTANDTKIVEKIGYDKTLESSAEEVEITKTKAEDLHLGIINKKRSIDPPNMNSTRVNDTYKIAEKSGDDKTLESSAEDVEITKTTAKDLNLRKTNKKRSTEPPIIKSTTANDTNKIAEKNADDKTLESSAEQVEITKTKTKDLNVGKTNKKRPTNIKSNETTKDSYDDKKSFEVKSEVLISKIITDEVNVTIVNDTKKVTEKSGDDKTLESSAEDVETTKTKAENANVGKRNKKISFEPSNIKSNEITKGSEDNKKAFEVKTKVLTSNIIVDGVNVTTTATDFSKITKKIGEDKTLESRAEAIETTRTKPKDLTVGKGIKTREKTKVLTSKFRVDRVDVTEAVECTEKGIEKISEDKTLKNEAEVVETVQIKTKDVSLGGTNKMKTLTSKVKADQTIKAKTVEEKVAETNVAKALENITDAVEATKSKAKDTTVGKTNKIITLENKKDTKKAFEEKTKVLKSKTEVEDDSINTVNDTGSVVEKRVEATPFKSIAEAVKTTQRKTKDLSIGITNKIASLAETEKTKVLTLKSRVETTQIIDNQLIDSKRPFDKNNERKVEKYTEEKAKRIKVDEATKTSKDNKSFEEINKVFTSEISVESCNSTECIDNTETAAKRSIETTTSKNRGKRAETIQIISNELITSHTIESTDKRKKDGTVDKNCVKISTDMIETHETSITSERHKKSFEEATKNITSEIKLQVDNFINKYETEKTAEKSTEDMTKVLVSENKVEAVEVTNIVEGVDTAVEKKIENVTKENRVDTAKLHISSNSDSSVMIDKTSDCALVVKSIDGQINEASISVEITESTTKAIDNAEPMVTNTEKSELIQSKPHVDPDDEIRKKLDHSIEMVFGNKNESNVGSIDILSKEGSEEASLTSKPTVIETQTILNKLEERNSDITTEQLDRGIDAILGSANRAYQQDKMNMENEEKSPTSKQKLGILTAQKINELFVERTKEKSKKSVFERDLEKSLIQSTDNIFNKIKHSPEEECTIAKTCGRELETAKKPVSKKSFADVKIVSANVPERVFADDESDNSSSGDTSSHDNYFPSIPHDDVTDNLKGDTVELPTNLEEANASNLETLALSSISDITTDPYFTSFPDILDQMLQSQTQAQETTDCMISGKNYVQKWSESSYAHESFKNKNVEETKSLDAVPIPVPSQNHNICIEQIFESNTNTIFFDEADVATNIGFDLDGNVTVEDLLAHDSDDLFPFSELDKSHSRSNSFSSDSEICANSGNDACEEISHASKTIACDHSYNKEAKGEDKNKTQIETMECIQGIKDASVAIPSTSKPENINEINKNLYKILDLDLGLSTASSTPEGIIVRRRSINSPKKYIPLQRKSSQEMEKRNNENFTSNKTTSPKSTSFKDVPFSRSKLNVNATVLWRKQKKEENSPPSKIDDVSTGEGNKNLAPKIICNEVSSPTTKAIIPTAIVSTTTPTTSPITSPNTPPNTPTIALSTTSPITLPTTPKAIPPTTPLPKALIIEPVVTPITSPTITLSIALPIIPTNAPIKASTTVSTTEPTKAHTSLPSTAITTNLTRDAQDVTVIDVKSKSNEVSIKPIESDISTEASNKQINEKENNEHKTTMKRNCSSEITSDNKNDIVEKHDVDTTVEAPKINKFCQESKSPSIVQSKEIGAFSKTVKTTENHTTIPIQSQPIITIHSQTNRLQRIDQIPNQSAVNREYSISPCTRSESSKREHTPTLDEESFLEERNSDSANSSNSGIDRSPFKRESTPTLDEPPQKKVCLEVVPEKLSSNDIFDILKKEPPVNIVVSKTASNEVNESSDLNKILMPVSSPPHHSEEVTIETVEEVKEHKLYDEVKKISIINVKNEKIQKSDNKDVTVSTLNSRDKNTKMYAPEIVQIDNKDQGILNQNQKDQNSKNSTHINAHKSVPITKRSISFDNSTGPVETTSNVDESKLMKCKVSTPNATINTSPSTFMKGSVKISPVLNKSSSTETCNRLTKESTHAVEKCKKSIAFNSKIDQSVAIKSTSNKTELSILSPQKSCTQTSINSSKISPNSSSKFPVAKLNPKEIVTPKSTSTSTPTLNVNNRQHPYSHSPNDATNNRNKYVYQRVPSLPEPKPTATKERNQFANATQQQKPINKLPPEQQTQNNISRNSQKSNISTLATNFKLSAADEKELAAKLKAYSETLPPAKIYREHVEQKLLIEKHEEKLRLEKRLEYLEKEKQRQIQQYKTEAQRLKRKVSNESMEAHYKKYASSSKSSTSNSSSSSNGSGGSSSSSKQQHQQQRCQQHHQQHQQQHQQPHQQHQQQHYHQQQKSKNRKVYVNKFSEIGREMIDPKKRKLDSFTNETPLTTPIAWEPKAPSVDEIMEHLAKMKKS